MEIKKFENIYYENEETIVFIKDNDTNKIEISLVSNYDLRYQGYAMENGVKIADNWNDTIKVYNSFGCAKVEPEMTFIYEDHLDDDDEGEAAQEVFYAAVDAAMDWLYPEKAAARAKEAAEKAAKRKAYEAERAAEAAREAAEEEARRATYGDEQDVAVLQVLYKALQQSKKPKMLINYASRFCPQFKSGRFEQPRTIIRAGGREYAFQFGSGWERIR
jgi:hypothetical protein